jgi:hypothetical protein
MRHSPVTTAAALAALLSSTPATAQAPAPAPSPSSSTDVLPPFETARTDAHSWMGRFGATNCAWFDLGDGVLLLDTGGTIGDAKNLLAEVKRSVPDKPVRWVAMTHLRPDANNGFAAMLPTDVILIVNARWGDAGPPQGAGKAPTIRRTRRSSGKSKTVEITRPAPATRPSISAPRRAASCPRPITPMLPDDSTRAPTRRVARGLDRSRFTRRSSRRGPGDSGGLEIGDAAYLAGRRFPDMKAWGAPEARVRELVEEAGEYRPMGSTRRNAGSYRFDARRLLPPAPTVARPGREKVPAPEGPGPARTEPVAARDLGDRIRRPFLSVVVEVLLVGSPGSGPCRLSPRVPNPRLRFQNCAGSVRVEALQHGPDPHAVKGGTRP